VCLSVNLNDGERVPVDQVEELSSAVSPSSPTKSTGKNSVAKFAVGAHEAESSLSNKESKHLDDWHDFSQISAGDEKDRLTPQSQIGFRDPASVGGGQQLTILSIEVLSHPLIYLQISMFFPMCPWMHKDNLLVLD
jgi:DNA polymerase zeta